MFKNRTIFVLFVFVSFVTMVSCSEETANLSDSTILTDAAMDISFGKDSGTTNDVGINIDTSDIGTNPVVDTVANSDMSVQQDIGSVVDMPQSCTGFVGAVTPLDTARTPRTDTEAELLALEATENVVAPQSVYDLVVRDLANIRSHYSQVATVKAMQKWVVNELLVEVKAAVVNDIKNGTYSGWDCPNALYKVINVGTSLLTSLHWAVLKFNGNYYIPGIINDYLSISDILNAEPNYIAGDGNDVCLEIDGNTYYYIFDAGSGDCPSGCISHTYWGFSVDSASANITYLGTFTKQTATPTWYTPRTNCTKWL